MEYFFVGLIVIFSIGYIIYKTKKEISEGKDGGCNCTGCPTSKSCDSEKKKQ